MFLALQAAILGCGFLAVVAVCVLLLNLHAGLIAGIVIGSIVWIILGALLCQLVGSLRPKPMVELRGSQLTYGTQTLDLMHPFQFQVHANGMAKTLQIDMAQGDVRLALELQHVSRQAVVTAFPDAGIQPVASLAKVHSFQTEQQSTEAWPFIHALLHALHAYRHNASPTADAASRPTHPLLATLVGCTAMILSCCLVTCIACIDWLPKAACLVFSPFFAAILWLPLIHKTGRFGWVAVLASLAMYVGGVFYASDWLMWSYGPVVSADHLTERGSFRNSRPRRFKTLQAHPQWGTPWMQERDGDTRWFYGLAAISTPKASPQKPVRLWAICEETGRGRNASKRFLAKLKQDCGDSWTGKAMQAVPWQHWDTYARFARRGAAKLGLKSHSHARAVYIFKASEVDWQKDRNMSLRLFFGPLVFWLIAHLFLQLYARVREGNGAAS